jgi:hypothetical protein
VALTPPVTAFCGILRHGMALHPVVMALSPVVMGFPRLAMAFPRLAMAWLIASRLNPSMASVAGLHTATEERVSHASPLDRA